MLFRSCVLTPELERVVRPPHSGTCGSRSTFPFSPGRVSTVVSNMPEARERNMERRLAWNGRLRVRSDRPHPARPRFSPLYRCDASSLVSAFDAAIPLDIHRYSYDSSTVPMPLELRSNARQNRNEDVPHRIKVLSFKLSVASIVPAAPLPPSARPLL
ncbi:hypothetical protein K438DRAFT_111352 [Mycena galopus ATCC 62051]|nr:hypothetical protein K438DRAFT_111352 [Mycena galopus ATCC 62051]